MAQEDPRVKDMIRTRHAVLGYLRWTLISSACAHLDHLTRASAPSPSPKVSRHRRSSASPSASPCLFTDLAKKYPVYENSPFPYPLLHAHSSNHPAIHRPRSKSSLPAPSIHPVVPVMIVTLCTRAQQECLGLFPHCRRRRRLARHLRRRGSSHSLSPSWCRTV